MPSLLTVLLAGILTNNYVLAKTTGICPFLGVSKKFQQAAGMGVAVIFVMLCATAATWPIYELLKRLELAGMLTVRSVEHGGRTRKYYHITKVGLAFSIISFRFCISFFLRFLLLF